MIDPRVALILVVIYATVWGVHKVVVQVEHLGHHVKTVATKVLHHETRK